MKKIEKSPLLEVIFMFTLCLVAVEWVVYPQFHQDQIYAAVVLCIIGITAAYFLQMKNFSGYFIVAFIGTLLAPLVWKIINGGWDEFLMAWEFKSIPFIEIPVTTYLVMGITIFFVLYATKRMPAITAKKQ